MSECGTSRTCQHCSLMSAIGGRPEFMRGLRFQRSDGDDPCHHRDLSRDKTECRAPRAWWPTPGGAQSKRGHFFLESEVMHHSCRNGTSRNNVTPTSN